MICLKPLDRGTLVYVSPAGAAAYYGEVVGRYEIGRAVFYDIIRRSDGSRLRDVPAERVNEVR